MIHAYASIWRCLKSAHKGGNGNNCQAVYREYIKVKRGSGGASPPEANGMLKNSNKMEASPFQRRGGGAVAWWLTPLTPNPGLLWFVLEQDIFTPQKYW